MAVEVKIDFITEGFTSARNQMESVGKSVKAMGDGIKALLGLELAEWLSSAASSAREFTLEGVKAARMSANFAGDLKALQKATGNAVDNTTLQRLDLMARKTGLASNEIADLSRLATQFARDSGQDMADAFQQLIDASPEQMEKWGILTSELAEELKELDPIAQKAALRQTLVAEGAKIANEEIAQQTSNVEELNARWENAVSGVQEWTAAVLSSDGARDATNALSASMSGLGDMLGIVGNAWGGITEELGGDDGLMGVLIESQNGLLTLGRLWGEMTDASSVALRAVDEFQESQKQGWIDIRTEMRKTYNAMQAAEKEQRDKAKKLAKERAKEQEALAKIDAMDSGALMGKDPKKRDRITLGAKKPSRGRSGPSEFDKAIASTQQKILDGWVQFRQDWAFQRWEAQKEFEAESIAMFESVASIVTGVAEGVLPDNGAWEQGLLSRLLMGPEPETSLEMMARFTGELDSLSASWSSLTTGMGSGADQVKGVIDAFSTLTAASPQLEEAQAKLGKGFDKSAQAIGTYASTGISAISAFTGAFVEDQKVQAGLMSAFEAAMALASWPDPVGIATHAAASALFGAVAAGAFDGGGGGSARGGAQAGAAFGAPTLADAFDGGGAGETQETTVIQLQVDGRTLGEASLRGANDVSSTFRRGETLQADAVGAGRKGLF